MDKSKIIRIGGSREGKKKYSKEDAKYYKGIKWVASKPIQIMKIDSGPRFPVAPLCAYMVDGENKWEADLFRQDLRDMLGKADADMDIEEYYEKTSLMRPWKVAPTRICYQEKSEKGKKETYTKEDIKEELQNKDAQSEEESQKKDA